MECLRTTSNLERLGTLGQRLREDNIYACLATAKQAVLDNLRKHSRCIAQDSPVDSAHPSADCPRPFPEQEPEMSRPAPAAAAPAWMPLAVLTKSMKSALAFAIVRLSSRPTPHRGQAKAITPGQPLPSCKKASTTNVRRVFPIFCFLDTPGVAVHCILASRFRISREPPTAKHDAMAKHWWDTFSHRHARRMVHPTMACHSQGSTRAKVSS